LHNSPGHTITSPAGTAKNVAGGLTDPDILLEMVNGSQNTEIQITTRWFSQANSLMLSQ